ncbi:Proton-translocating ferredoxin:NAD(+) oxidoreductase complex subunit D [Candidatus Magnetaquicoccaceae bacterium FCR-1]|uniref:Ion-translocating oxidoreductase complex subunit D n=1 Tax=Candidatus Magnetaquiglobus chichijimensis TaxID=3141448 RepID=A0ABQ0C8I0_9PROT
MTKSSFKISSSPFVHGGLSISEVMKSVIWALLPAAAMGVMVFGWSALFVMLITVAACVVSERLFNAIRGRPSTVGDQSALLTGLLLAMSMPPNSPWWLCLVGGVFAIVLGKQLYGGMGYNMFNPAMIARVFLLISFPVQMTSWPAPTPLTGDHALSLSQGLAMIISAPFNTPEMLDALSTATPLGQYHTEIGMGKTVREALGGAFGFDILAAMGGMIKGSLGETSAILLTLGGIYLLRKKIITWHIPMSMILGCIVPAAIFWLIDHTKYPDPLFHLVTGGLIIAAFFMATDYVTSPVTPKGQIIFGVGCGLLTFLIRTWGSYPEGVSFAIVIMNATVPLIDQYTRPLTYGKKKQTL